MKRLAAVVMCLCAGSAFAEMATVKVFEAKAYERADVTSAVLHLFVEKAEVSVSEEAENGFRKVRLPDGRVAYIQESALQFAAASTVPAAAVTAADAPTVSAAVPRPNIYVKDLAHFAELVKSDEVVHPMALNLANRETTAKVVGWGGLGVGTALAIAGFFILPRDGECYDIAGQRDCLMGPTNYTTVGVGLGLAAVSAVAFAVMLPKREDVLDAVNTWNTRHPTEQFDLDRQPSSMR